MVNTFTEVVAMNGMTSARLKLGIHYRKTERGNVTTFAESGRLQEKEIQRLQYIQIVPAFPCTSTSARTPMFHGGYWSEIFQLLTLSVPFVSNFRYRQRVEEARNDSGLLNALPSS